MRILIADDHTIVRAGIKMLLLENFPTAYIVDVENAAELLKSAGQNVWDVIITDISMPPGDSGLEAVKKIRESSPGIPVIVLSMYAPGQYAIRSVRAGASGYLTKCAAGTELVKAVNVVLSGKRYISDDVAGLMADSIENHDASRSIQNLSHRELEVFTLLAHGKSVADIAKELILSTNTISTFRGRLLEKMNFQNNLELIKYAVDNRLV